MIEAVLEVVVYVFAEVLWAAAAGRLLIILVFSIAIGFLAHSFLPESAASDWIAVAIAISLFVGVGWLTWRSGDE